MNTWQFPYPLPTNPHPTTVKKILVVGDSLANVLGQNMQSRFAAWGYQATVYNEAVLGTTLCEWHNTRLTAALAAHPDAQLIVGQFLANVTTAGCPAWGPVATYVDGNADRVWYIEDYIDHATAIPMYWIITPRCGGWPTVNRAIAELADHANRSVHHPIDLRPWFAVPDDRTYNEQLILDGYGAVGVRVPTDGIHFTTTGALLALDVVLSEIAGLW